MILQHIESRGGFLPLLQPPSRVDPRQSSLGNVEVQREIDSKTQPAGNTAPACKLQDKWEGGGALGDLVRRIIELRPPDLNWYGEDHTRPEVGTSATGVDNMKFHHTNTADFTTFDHVAYTWATMPEELKRRAAALSVQDGFVLQAHVLRNLRSFALKAQKTLNARVHAQARKKTK